MSDDWGEGTLPAPGPTATDEDRQRVAARLRDAAGDGVLGLDELEDRLGRALAAEHLTELASLTKDLPDRRPSAPPGRSGRDIPALRNVGFRYHLQVYALVIGMLVLMWMAGGFGHPWPIYPAAGWGIGLGSHYLAANEAQCRKDRRRLERAAKRDRIATPERPSVPSSTPLSGRSPSPRRFVAAMFVDVVGSTGLNEALGDEGWVKVRDRLRTMLRASFEREGGWEVSSAGDGVLARFDHPNAAACAAVEVMRRLSQQREDTGFAPSVRIGIHSGDVVEDGDDIIGSVVNLASRVTSAGEPDQIMVTEHVADHLDSTLHTEDRGIHSLRGISKPRHLLTVRWQ